MNLVLIALLGTFPGFSNKWLPTQDVSSVTKINIEFQSGWREIPASWDISLCELPGVKTARLFSGDQPSIELQFYPNKSKNQVETYGDKEEERELNVVQHLSLRMPTKTKFKTSRVRVWVGKQSAGAPQVKIQDTQGRWWKVYLRPKISNPQFYTVNILPMSSHR
jgi:hypothetical protein